LNCYDLHKEPTMNVTLSAHDFRALPAEAQEAILQLLLDSRQRHGSPDGPIGGLVEMGYDMFSRFVRGVSATTRACLRVFAENGGTATPEQLLAVTDYTEPGMLRGVHAGITKRTRKLLEDPEAYLISWKGREDDWDGEWYVSSVTYESMKRFFELA